MSLDTNVGSWKTKAMIVAPLVAGGVIGEYIDQKGYDDMLLSKLPKVGQPFDRLIPIAALFVFIAVFIKTADIAGAKWKAGSLLAGAVVGVLVNYASKLILGAKTAGGGTV